MNLYFKNTKIRCPFKTQVEKKEGSTAVSETRKKNKTIKEVYFQGGQGPYVFTENSIIWSFKSTDISFELHTFRNKCLNAAVDKNFSFVEEIALNGVFYIDKAANQNFCGIDEGICSELSFKKNPQNSIAEASVWFSQCKEQTNGYYVAKALIDILKEPLFQSLFVEPLLIPFVKKRSLAAGVPLAGNPLTTGNPLNAWPLSAKPVSTERSSSIQSVLLRHSN
ncbi:uncharacterized protein EV154DRAFT_480358 [Mucor mucedo]|uniref:uncharacterized protein n=1 Tax=Mucor mucedo TaxID=29922 RepID=UPI0022207D0F|nr:uncharacterized protein EV154DRAFT_480358 [Mucor mucedo]KAI7892412.1 hypothetical protein EV154DRAFT_480358 [Mucor mucedo]